MSIKERIVKRSIGVLAVAVLALAACGGGNGDDDVDDTSPDAVAAGQEVFSTTCLACHGPNGEGIEGLGTDLTTSQFVRDLSDDELVAYLEVGRPADDPANTTGIAMPAKGGRPTLTTEDLANVVAFLRTINS